MRQRFSYLVSYAVVLIVLLAASCSPASHPATTGPASPSPEGDQGEPSPTPTLPTPSPTVTTSPTPYSTPTPEPVPKRLVRKGDEGKALDLNAEETPEQHKVAETEHFTVYAPAGELPAAVPDLPERAERVLEEVTARLGPLAEERGGIRITFRPPSTMACPPRGLASSRPPRIIIFADDQTTEEQILGVLAHELGHVVIMHRFERIPSAFNEGLATWGSVPYFNAWLGNASLDAAVRAYLEDSTYLPLRENYYLTNIYPGEEQGTSESCITRRETLYIEWASFLDYLMERHGVEKLEELIETTPDVEMTEEALVFKPADFEAVYGSSLNQLEAAWLRQIARR